MGKIVRTDCSECLLEGYCRKAERTASSCSGVIRVSFDSACGPFGRGLSEFLRENGAVTCGTWTVVEAGAGEESDVIISSLDCMNLEESLLNVTCLMDRGRRTVLVTERYGELLATDHSIDFDTLGMLLGFPVVNESKGADAVLEAVVSICEDALWLPKIIQGRHMDEEEHARMGFVTGALQETVRHSNDDSKHTVAQKVDALLTNKWLGLPLLMLVLFSLFELTFAVGAYPQQWIEWCVDKVAFGMKDLIPAGWAAAMLTDGVVRGVGAVLAFLPNIVILFFLLSLLEDSGYMARAAYVMDKIMHRVGLHGNSFIPMLIGFGCNVPAIMAARGIQNRKDRLLTMLMIPFMSCSARLPVYMLFVSAFFMKYKALVMMGLYVTGVVIAILFAFMMKRTRYFRKGTDDYVSELPPFHAPKMKDTWAHIWDRVKDYLQKISSVILVSSVVIWALEYFPADRTDNGKNREESVLAMIGRAAQPLTAPLGFDWKMNVCVLTGLPAKEAIVSTMGILYHSDEDVSLEETMRESGAFNTANSIAFLLFVLLYFPCIATVATLRREAGVRWAAFTVVHSMLLAYFVAFLANFIFG